MRSPNQLISYASTQRTLAVPRTSIIKRIPQQQRPYLSIGQPVVTTHTRSQKCQPFLSISQQLSEQINLKDTNQMNQLATSFHEQKRMVFPKNKPLGNETFSKNCQIIPISLPEIESVKSTNQSQDLVSYNLIHKQPSQSAEQINYEDSSSEHFSNLSSSTSRQSDSFESKACLSSISRAEGHHMWSNSFDDQEFLNHTDFIGSQRAPLSELIREMDYLEEQQQRFTIQQPSNKVVSKQKQEILKVLQVVRVKKSGISLAKVSVQLENKREVNIQYMNIFEVRQTHPQLLLDYYERAFHPYILEISHII